MLFCSYCSYCSLLDFRLTARIAANRRPYNENKFAASIYKHNGYITESIMGSITGFMTIL